MWESMHIDGVPPGIGGGMVEAEMNENNGGGGADDEAERAHDDDSRPRGAAVRFDVVADAAD